MFTILIAGSGQIGSRYLQGMFYCKIPLNIYVHDISEQSLHTAKKRWEQMIESGPKTQHKVSYISKFEKIPEQIDFAVVATNADIRAQVVKQIVKKSEVHYWVLEKILAQSEKALDDISSMTQNSEGAWVNISRRMMSWQKKIQQHLQNDFPLSARTIGQSWGMACNGIHLLDLVAWWTGETLKSLNNSELDSQWIEGKRKGFYEITGKIEAVYSEGSTFSLESSLDEKPYSFEVDTYEKNWIIDEQRGVFYSTDGVLITGKNDMQSTMTSRLVEALLESGQCDLTNMSESVEMHRVFLRSLLEHWNHVYGTNVDILPIT